MDNNFRRPQQRPMGSPMQGQAVMPNRLGLSDALSQYGASRQANNAPTMQQQPARFNPRPVSQLGAAPQQPASVMQQQPARMAPSKPLPQFQAQPQMRPPSMPLRKPSQGLLGIGSFEQNQLRNMPKRRF